jgi:hypothetical protein
MKPSTDQDEAVDRPAQGVAIAVERLLEVSALAAVAERRAEHRLVGGILVVVGEVRPYLEQIRERTLVVRDDPLDVVDRASIQVVVRRRLPGQAELQVPVQLLEIELGHQVVRAARVDLVVDQEAVEAGGLEVREDVGILEAAQRRIRKLVRAHARLEHQVRRRAEIRDGRGDPVVEEPVGDRGEKRSGLLLAAVHTQPIAAHALVHDQHDVIGQRLPSGRDPRRFPLSVVGNQVGVGVVREQRDAVRNRRLVDLRVGEIQHAGVGIDGGQRDQAQEDRADPRNPASRHAADEPEQRERSDDGWEVAPREEA